MYYTYALYGEKDKNFYTGFTKNLEKRLQEHFNGLVTSTAHRRPFKVMYYKACIHKTDAIKREKYFKSGYGRRFLRNRLESFLKEFN